MFPSPTGFIDLSEPDGTRIMLAGGQKIGQKE